jgi:sugar lactone lactonase YvrE
MKKLAYVFAATLVLLSLIAINGYSQELNRPESIVYSPTQNCYYISNSGNGQIIRMDGVNNFKLWATGLKSPKGLLILNNILYANDVSWLRGFNIMTGEKVVDVFIEGSTFLNDNAADSSGSIYITDTEQNKIYKFNTTTQSYEAMNLKDIKSPNGLVYDHKHKRLILVSILENCPIQEISLITYNVKTLVKTKFSKLDGLAIVTDGYYYFTSWEAYENGAGKLNRIRDDFKGKAETVQDGLSGPADICFNPVDSNIAIPNMLLNKITWYKIKSKH